jgi:general secretion pathway protein G
MTTMASHLQTEPRVFFPWERQRGLLGALGRRRVRVLLFGGFAFVGLAAAYQNGERSAAVRATRATLTTVSRALSAYRADHGAACPRDLGELVAGAYLRAEPLDAWGRPLRLVCPGRTHPEGVDLTSDGPDGVPGGLDGVE